MKTVGQVSELAGVSIRTLHYYDRIGLLCPSSRTDAGYRLYSDEDLRRLQQILLFRELEFSLEDIRRVLDSPGFDRDRALAQQLAFLDEAGCDMMQGFMFSKARDEGQFLRLVDAKG